MIKRFGQWLKKYFIPHEHNDHQPHILRTETTLLILAIVLFIEVGFLTQILVFSRTNLFALILSNVLIGETNDNRQSENIPSLNENPLLDAAAKMKAEDMAEKEYFAHTSPDGTEPWYWLKRVGYDYSYAGENLAINFFDSEDVIKAWLNSPTHRQNILNPKFTEIGIATAKGTYEGRETVFIVQMFGRPAEIQAPVPPPIASEVAGIGPVLSATTKASGASALTQKAIASPKTTVNYFYAILIFIISLALILNIFIKVKIQHPKLILNAVILLLLINAALLLNHYLSLANTKVL